MSAYTRNFTFCIFKLISFLSVYCNLYYRRPTSCKKVNFLLLYFLIGLISYDTIETSTSFQLYLFPAFSEQFKFEIVFESVFKITRLASLTHYKIFKNCLLKLSSKYNETSTTYIISDLLVSCR